MSNGFTETSLNDIPIDDINSGSGGGGGLGNPNINDIELQNIVREIQQEQQQHHQQPEIPTESYGQSPPMPQQQFQQSYQNIANKMQQEHLHNQSQPLFSPSSLFSPQSALSSVGASRPTKIINDITGNLKLIVIIVLTYVLLQQPQVRYFILNRITTLQNQHYYVQTMIFGLFQVLLIVLLKNFS